MPAQRIVVDRIEGDIAVVELAGTTVDVPVALLPAGAGEGSVLTFSLAAAGTDASQTAARLAKLQAKSNIGDDFTF
jgi:hypothetical protein